MSTTNMDDDIYSKIFRSFKALSRNKNKTYKHDGLYEINERSFFENFKIVFGHENQIIK